MASMYFQYGGYAHPPGEVQVNSYDRVSNFNDQGFATSVTVTMSLSGIIVPTAAQISAAGSGAVAIDRRVREIQDAYALNGKSAALMLPNGAQSALAIDSGSSLYGVQVVNGPSFPMERNAAHYATGLPYNITLKAEYGPGNIGLADSFLGSSETIEMIGDGGPITAITLLDNGPPIIDIVSPASPVIVTQSGEASYEMSSLLAPTYPPYGVSIWPDALIRPDGIRRNRTKSRPKQGKVQYKSTWSYTHQFTRLPFIPNPTA